MNIRKFWVVITQVSYYADESVGFHENMFNSRQEALDRIHFWDTHPSKEYITINHTIRGITVPILERFL